MCVGWGVPGAELEVGSWLVEGRLASSEGWAGSSSDWLSNEASPLVLIKKKKKKVHDSVNEELSFIKIRRTSIAP